MIIDSFFPFWENLTNEQKNLLQKSVSSKHIKKGQQIYSNTDGCLGFVIVKKGMLRIFITSEEAKEITLFRLQPQNMCLFSAGCIYGNLSFTIQIQALEDTEVLLIPANIFKSITNSNVHAANYINTLMAERFNNVMWLIDQIVFKSFDQRLSDYIKKEAEQHNSRILNITHEIIARDLGTAREVVSRMLKHFEEEELVKLGRGTIEISQI